MIRKREINMIPHDVIMGNRIRGRIWMWAVITQLIIISLLGGHMMDRRATGTVEREISDLLSKKAGMEKNTEQLNVLQNRRDMLMEKKRAISELLRKKSLSSMFAEIEAVMGHNVWLTSFDYSDDFRNSRNEDVAGKKDQQGEQRISQGEASTLIRGMARSNKDLAGFLQRLLKSRYFSEVGMKYSRQGTYEGKNVVEFEIGTQNGYQEN
ncbi:MAG: PilN domain-containing protein [Nitrospirae bacterium]|nr:PilN domain-containing protein [Nitrospirota bacterium]